VNRYSLTHLSNDVLRSELTAKTAREKEATAELLAHMAEFDERKLYLAEAYESMRAYCTGALGLADEAAAKRIYVARAGRSCAGVFEALAEGRVHLSGLVLLAKYLKTETATELLAAAAHKSKADIERLIAERFPRADVAASVTTIPTAPLGLAASEHSPGNAAGRERTVSPASEHARARVAPLSAERYAVQFTRCREADERFRYAQDLLGHQVKIDDLAEVYRRAIEALIEKIEKVRFGAGAKPRTGGLGTKSGSRHVPVGVKRAVWIRDEGQCTYVSGGGRRCECRRDLQFDHIREFARGGEATVGNLRLRCPAHNQHAAEQTYGAGFMKQRREEAKAARDAARAAKQRARVEKAAELEKTRLQPHQLEVIPWLEQLGCRKDHSRVAVERCRDMMDAPLEDRVKRALGWFGDRIARKVRWAAPAAAPHTTGALG